MSPSVDDRPYFSARDIADSTVEFWCLPCKRWHTHSKPEVGGWEHRVSHCKAYPQGYFIRCCGAYDDDEWTRRLTKNCNEVEYTNWLYRNMPAGRTPVREWRELAGLQQVEDSYMAQGDVAVKFHWNEKSSAISTNATTEQEFVAKLASALAVELDLSREQGGDLGVLLPQIVDICCKLRGYKSNVVEHRVIVAGQFLPDDVVEAFANYKREVLEPVAQ